MPAKVQSAEALVGVRGERKENQQKSGRDDEKRCGRQALTLAGMRVRQEFVCLKWG